MAAGQDISVNITWPVTDAATAYATHLTSVPDGSIINNSDADTTSWTVTLLSGYAYHQETIAITPTGSEKIKVYDFVAGQPAPPPSNLQVFDLSKCISSSHTLQVDATGYTVNSEYKDGTPVISFNLNGSYPCPWVQDVLGWQSDSFTAWVDEDVPFIVYFYISCLNGQYTITGAPYVGEATAISLGGSVDAQYSDDNPQDNVTTGGSVALSIAS